MLRNDNDKNIIFDMENSLNFEGDTGPYIQYSYARASSILKKAAKEKSGKIKTKNIKIKIPNRLEPSEINLIKKILDFPEIVKSCGEKLSPSQLANYSFELAQIFNNFYTQCRVIGAESGSETENFRLALVEAFRITIKNSLYLLGIEALEEM
jgi:arginyl-tRNA synthetase